MRHLFFPVGFAVAAAVLAVERCLGLLFPESLRHLPVGHGRGAIEPHPLTAGLLGAPGEIHPGVRVHIPDIRQQLLPAEPDGAGQAVGLAITGALAVMCMAKVYGVTFLGAPRTKEAENATCAPLLMSVSVVALAICCVIGGVAAPWLLPMLSAAVPLPLEPANTTVSQPMITLLLIACPLLPFIIMAICKGDRLPSRSRGAAWVCGYDHEKSMVITAHGFAMPVKQAFAPVLKLRKWLNPVSLVPGWQCEGSALLFRRMALVELAVLVVIIVSRGA